MNRIFKSKTIIIDKPPREFHEPPIKVIRAMSDFESDDKSKLSFARGDYFYVTSFDLKKPNLYYVVNPLTNVSGMVDAKYFEYVERKMQAPITPPFNDDASSNYGTSTRSEYPGVSRRRTKSKAFDSNSVYNGFSNQVIRTGMNRKRSVSSVRTFNSMISPIEPHGNYLSSTIPSFTEDTLTDSSFIPQPMVDQQVTNNNMNPHIDLASDSNFSSQFSLSQIEYISVSEKANDKYSITLMDGNVKGRMIFRSFDDIYSFHLQLLAMFPGHTGEYLSPRIIPFLSLPSKDVGNRDPTKEFENYLLESKCLPGSILNSRLWVEFLKMRNGDQELDESFIEDEDAVLDLLLDYSKPTSVKIKISISNGNTYSFKTEKNCTLRNMLKSLESKLSRKMTDLFYWNENRQMSKIQGDQDLQLLFRTCPNPRLYSK